MSKPPKPLQLPLLDPHGVIEVFANDLAGVQVRDDGTCHLTFSVIRPGHRMQTPGITRNDLDVDRVVVARIVVPLAVFNAMGNAIQQMQVGMAIPQGSAPQTALPN